MEKSDYNEGFFVYCSLEMLEKIEPPTSIPPGYGISVAYATLLDIVRSISLAIQGPSVVSRYSWGIYLMLKKGNHNPA